MENVFQKSLTDLVRHLMPAFQISNSKKAKNVYKELTKNISKDENNYNELIEKLPNKRWNLEDADKVMNFESMKKIISETKLVELEQYAKQNKEMIPYLLKLALKTENYQLENLKEDISKNLAETPGHKDMKKGLELNSTIETIITLNKHLEENIKVKKAEKAMKAKILLILRLIDVFISKKEVEEKTKYLGLERESFKISI